MIVMPVDTISMGATYPNFILINGIYAYILGGGKFSIVDISVSPPKIKSSTQILQYPTKLQVISPTRIIAVSQYNNILMIFDVSNPELPIIVGQITTGSAPYSVSLSDSKKIAYVINNSSSTMQSFDISNNSNITLLSSVTVGANPVGLYVLGNIICVSNGYDTIQIFNTNFLLLSTTITQLYPYNNIIFGNIVYVVCTNVLSVYDISYPNSPLLIKNITISTPIEMKIFKNYLFIVTGDNIFYIYDIHNPINPTLIGNAFGQGGSYIKSVSATGNIVCSVDDNLNILKTYSIFYNYSEDNYGSTKKLLRITNLSRYLTFNGQKN